MNHGKRKPGSGVMRGYGGRRRCQVKRESISGGLVSRLSDVNVIMIVVANLRAPALPGCFYKQISCRDTLDDDSCLTGHGIESRDQLGTSHSKLGLWQVNIYSPLIRDQRCDYP